MTDVADAMTGETVGRAAARAGLAPRLPATTAVATATVDAHVTTRRDMSILRRLRGELSG